MCGARLFEYILSDPACNSFVPIEIKHSARNFNTHTHPSALSTFAIHLLMLINLKWRPMLSAGDDDDDIEYRLSEGESGGGSGGGERAPCPVRGPELFCQHCGVAFQRADLLRRHVAAAHRYCSAVG